MMNIQKISVIVGCAVGLSALLGAVFQADQYYAHAEEVRGLAKKIEYTNQRIERKIKEDQLYNIRVRKWSIGDRIIVRGESPSLKKELRELEHAEDRLRSELGNSK